MPPRETQRSQAASANFTLKTDLQRHRDNYGLKLSKQWLPQGARPHQNPRGIVLGHGGHGNRCYQNVVHQSLMHTPIFVRWIVSHNTPAEAGHDTAACIMCSYKDLATQYWTDVPNANQPIPALDPALEQIANAAIIADPWAFNQARGDPDEFYGWVTGQMQWPVPAGGFPQSESRKRRWNEEHHALFELECQQTSTCYVCGTVAARIGVTGAVEVAFDPAMTNLAEVLDEGFFHEDVALLCATCGGATDHMLRRTIEAAPQVLRIHVNLVDWVGGQAVKHMNQWNVPDQLDLRLRQVNTQLPLEYTLNSAIAHDGGDVSIGVGGGLVVGQPLRFHQVVNQVIRAAITTFAEQGFQPADGMTNLPPAESAMLQQGVQAATQWYDQNVDANIRSQPGDNFLGAIPNIGQEYRDREDSAMRGLRITVERTLLNQILYPEALEEELDDPMDVTIDYDDIGDFYDDYGSLELTDYNDDHDLVDEIWDERYGVLSPEHFHHLMFDTLTGSEGQSDEDNDYAEEQEEEERPVDPGSPILYTREYVGRGATRRPSTPREGEHNHDENMRRFNGLIEVTEREYIDELSPHLGDLSDAPERSEDEDEGPEALNRSDGFSTSSEPTPEHQDGGSPHGSHGADSQGTIDMTSMDNHDSVLPPPANHTNANPALAPNPILQELYNYFLGMFAGNDDVDPPRLPEHTRLVSTMPDARSRVSHYITNVRGPQNNSHLSNGHFAQLAPGALSDNPQRPNDLCFMPAGYQVVVLTYTRNKLSGSWGQMERELVPPW